MDLAWDSTAMELVFNDDFEIVEGDDEALQAMELQLASNFGEHEFFPGEGLRWEQVIGAPEDGLTLVEAELKRCLLATPGVSSLTSFSAEVTEAGELAFAFEAQLESGAVVSAEGGIDDGGVVSLVPWVG